MKVPLSLVFAAVFPVCCAGVAHSAIVGIDIDDGGAPPTNWNRHQSGGFMNLIDETGAATSIDVTIVTDSQSIPQGINAGTKPSHVPDLAGLNDFDTVATSVTFSDLVAGAPYRVWIFSVYDDFGVSSGGSQFNATVTGTGAPSVFAFNINAAGNLVINGVTGTNAALETFAAPITASPGGTIDIAFASTGGTGEVPLAGVAIELVPEPSGLCLAAIGLCGAARLARRRK